MTANGNCITHPVKNSALSASGSHSQARDAFYTKLFFGISSVNGPKLWPEGDNKIIQEIFRCYRTVLEVAFFLSLHQTPDPKGALRDSFRNNFMQALGHACNQQEDSGAN